MSNIIIGKTPNNDTNENINRWCLYRLCDILLYTTVNHYNIIYFNCLDDNVKYIQFINIPSMCDGENQRKHKKKGKSKIQSIRLQWAPVQIKPHYCTEEAKLIIVFHVIFDKYTHIISHFFLFLFTLSIFHINKYIAAIEHIAHMNCWPVIFSVKLSN